MKYLMILTAGVCLLFTSVPMMADQTEDEAAIRKAEEMCLAAHHSHDATALAATYDENAENWIGTIKGRAVIEKQYGENYAGPLQNLKIKVLDEIGIVFVTPDVAIYKARYEFSGMLDEEGKALPTNKVLYAKVFVKKNGKWLGAHGYFYRSIEE